MMATYNATQIRRLELDIHPNGNSLIFKGDKISCCNSWGIRLVHEINGESIAVLSRIQGSQLIDRTVYLYSHPDSKRVVLEELTSERLKIGDRLYNDFDRQLREARL